MAAPFSYSGFRCCDLQQKLLRDENEQLAKNISCLFNTARAELDRKDKWINKLRQDLEVAQKKIRQQEEKSRR